MKISIFRDGYTTLESTETIDSFDEFVDIVSMPKVGPKNGDYFIRGFCEGNRKDSNVKSTELIIIDGDIDLNGNSCPPPDFVHKLFKEKNITHVVYSSYSNDIVNNIHKWRLCIPCKDIIDAQSLKMGVYEVLNLMHRNSLMVKNVKENLVLSQPWFTPRCQLERYDDFYCEWHDGDVFKITGTETAASVNINFENHNTTASSAECFRWDYMIDQFQSGTLHNGLKAACGWIIHTTDWADVQIKNFLIAQVKALCNDNKKVTRAEKTKEIDNLIKYCREKHGVIEHSSNWKDHLTTAEILKDKHFDDVKWAVHKIIPEGLTVLAGEPKAGKSLMAVDICSAIASGGVAFGQRDCVEGDVVYMSLEDPERRVKERIENQCDLWPGRFKVLTGGVPQLGKSFYDLLDEMFLLWPEMRCIVVDTMQFIIPPKAPGLSDYEHYYKCLDPLHRWTIENHISIVLITHTTKSLTVEGDNPFSKIIGSVAIQGASDAMILLKKNHAKTVKTDELADGFLTINGRELNSETFSLDFDEELLKWTIRGEIKSKDYIKNPNWVLITDCIKPNGSEPSEIIRETGLNKSTVRSCLHRMKKAEIIEKKGPLYIKCNAATNLDNIL